jgi:large subunit ribosomal protein L21e
MPHLRFHGKTGTVIGNQGRAFVLAVKDGDKIKTVLARPEHMRKVL